MKILFTGASSFTGMWFVKALKAAGHTVTATFRRREYSGMRQERIAIVKEHCDPIWECAFGDEKFIDLLKTGSFDLLCHHGADVENYRSPDFDYLKAAQNNTHNIKKVLETGIQRVLLTGSVFEPEEGTGSACAVSPYGLSKGITCEIFRYWCHILDIQLGKFVIPNPYGPFEEDRFSTYLAKTWLKHAVAEVKTPEYIRDNIHVELLAKGYALFAWEMAHTTKKFVKKNPSGARGTQGEFTQKLSQEFSKRWGLPCHFTLCKQTHFFEPLKRTNTHPLDIDWNEAKSFDELATFYQKRYGN
ncbi:MAG: NAD(P)-dependent oxidoreductase [Waddliaceae bacterium]